MKVFSKMFLPLVLFSFVDYIKGGIDCGVKEYSSFPDRLLSTFEIENENVDVILVKSENVQRIPMFVLAADGTLTQNHNSNNVEIAFYDSESPIVSVRVKFNCNNFNEEDYSMVGLIVWKKERYIINSEDDTQYLDATREAHLTKNKIIEVDKEEKERSSRLLAPSPVYKAEVLVVVDYSLYAVFYNDTSDDLDVLQRSTETKQSLEEYLGLVFHSVNVAYKSLTTYSLNVEIVPVSIIISETRHKSPWTITKGDFSPLKGSKGEHMLNGSEVLDHLADFVSGLSTIPKPDHTLLYSKYDIDFEEEKPDNETETVGLATVRGICSDHSVSMVRDDMDFSVVSVTSHEIGHSLGSEHDEDGNSCLKSLGNIMAPKEHRSEPNQWIFSKCSADYFKTQIVKLNRYKNNCLLTDSYSQSVLIQSLQEWFGQTYSADQQCVLVLGNGSYLDRGTYNGSTEYHDLFCLNMTCTDPTGEFDYHYNAGDGTVCGRNKWCMAGHCVSASITLNVSDDCPQGDSNEVVRYDMRCSELVNKRPQECYIEKVRKPCCDICAKVKHNLDVTTLQRAPTANEQCTSLYGNDSYFCQNSNSYNESYSVICKDMFCLTNETANECSGIAAADGTICGHKQWCVQGVCVHSRYTSDLKGDCLYGDREQWCKTEFPQNKYICYNENNTKSCCHSCSKLIDQSRPDCLYGDHDPSWCREHIADSTTYKCYDEDNLNYCCDTCAKHRNNSNPDCFYGDRSTWCQQINESEKIKCNYGNNSNLCCGSCDKLRDFADQECPFGDKHVWCKDEIPNESMKYKCLVGNNTYDCCATCEEYRKSYIPEYIQLQKTPSVDQQCVDKYGDDSKFCQGVSDYTSSYESVCQDMYCLRNDTLCHSLTPADGTTCGYRKWCVQGTCVYSNHTSNRPADCLYSDKENWCKTSIPDETKKNLCYYGDNAKSCCDTCRKYANTSNSDCLYGDKSTWCKKNILDVSHRKSCYYGNNADLCCDSCKRFKNDSLPGCEYGDRSSNCKRANCALYSEQDRTNCCETCQ